METKTNYSNKNAEVVLKKVQDYIKYLSDRPSWNNKLSIRNVYSELSIFDWWVDYIGISKLKDMEKFLKEAIKLGYKGYVCFKVGATGCANGMWAHKEESSTGYSPDGDFLYKSFTPAYNYWSFKKDEILYPEGYDEYDSIKTIKDLEKLHKEIHKGE